MLLDGNVNLLFGRQRYNFAGQLFMIEFQPSRHGFRSQPFFDFFKFFTVKILFFDLNYIAHSEQHGRNISFMAV